MEQDKTVKIGCKLSIPTCGDTSRKIDSSEGATKHTFEGCYSLAADLPTSDRGSLSVLRMIPIQDNQVDSKNLEQNLDKDG